MTSYHFNAVEAGAELRACITYIEYSKLCSKLMIKWYGLIDYFDLDEWFESNRCCLPISLSRMLDKRIIKADTTLIIL